MRVFEDEIESEEEEEEEEEDRSQICTSGKHFACGDDLSLVINNKKTQIEEEIRNQISVVETEILHEIETFRSAIAKVETYREARKQVEGKLDLHYQRLVAEALDTSLTAVQERAHEEIARAEALLQATIRSEEEAKKEAEQRKEEERKLAEERVAIRADEEAEQRKAEERVAIRAEEEAEQRKEKVVCNGQAADIALTLEKQRLKKLELQETNKLLKSGSNQDFSRFENRVARVMKQISGTEDRVTANINDVLRIFEDPSCPVSISIATFAKKLVSSKGTLANPYACSYVVVYVTSKFPQAMDVLLAEFHKACLYTVPRNDGGDVAMDASDYYERLDSVMRLYGALVQTDVRENIHGIEHGWAWLARFLNKTEAHNKATATALNAFLRSAGFGLHKRYRSQFLKLMSVVREHFLAKLMAEEKGDCSGLQAIVSDITAYLDYQMYLEEPKGRSMQKNHLRSRDITGF